MPMGANLSHLLGSSPQRLQPDAMLRTVKFELKKREFLRCATALRVTVLARGVILEAPGRGTPIASGGPNKEL